MTRVTPYELRVGDTGPRQHSDTTCGSASLTVARMLADPVFAGWVFTGDAGGHGFLPARATSEARLAAVEQLTLRRTTRVVGPGGRLQPPWPRFLGTPPWGAKHELEHGASAPGTSYDVHWCRFGGARTRRRHAESLRSLVRPGRPAALYVGSASLPRHVTLLLQSQQPEQPELGADLALYDPSDGSVRAFDVDRFTAGALGVAGWDVPWCTVHARGSLP